MVPKADCVLPRRAVPGDVVTFTHDFSHRQASNEQDSSHGNTRTQDIVRGLPSNPVVHRIRSDLFWEDVVHSSGLPVRLFQNGVSPPSHHFFSNLSYRVIPKNGKYIATKGILG